MKAEGEHWLLSLSVLSLLGPKPDIDRLTAQGFYKKPSSGGRLFSKDLDTKDQINQGLIQGYLEDMGITDREKFYQVLDAAISGSEFGHNIERLMQLGKTMNVVDREKKQSFIMNGHPYLYETFEEVMTYEFHWPKEGFFAYDLANAIMLVRLGLGLEYMDEDLQSDYLERLQPLAKKVFESYKTFGCDAAIGRSIHCKYLQQVGAGKMTTHEKEVLAMAYYSLWQYMA